MHDPREGDPAGEDFDPDAVLWVPGVDYISGWREAKNAAAELTDALTAAGVETEGLRLRADADAGGGGVIRLACSPQTARELAMLVRVTAARLRNAS